MRKTLRVNPKTHLVCIPQEMVEDGMVGDIDAYPNAVTITLVVPGANMHDVKSSLLRVVEDIEQRIDFADRKTPIKSKPSAAREFPLSLDELRTSIKKGLRK